MARKGLFFTLGLGLTGIVLVGGLVWTILSASSNSTPALVSGRRDRDAILPNYQLSIAIEKYDPAAERFTGTVNLTVNAQPMASQNLSNDERTKVWVETQVITRAQFNFIRANPVEPTHFFAVGQADDYISLKQISFQRKLEGKSGFSWPATVVVPTFNYPFDQYFLVFNPFLLIPNTSGVKHTRALPNTVDLKFRAPNMQMIPSPSNMKLPALSDDYSDLANVIVYRPPVTQILVIATGISIFLYLGYILIKAESAALWGNSVALVTGMWGARAILITDVGLFPLLLDYYVLWATISVVVINLVKIALGLLKTRTSNKSKS